MGPQWREAQWGHNLEATKALCASREGGFADWEVTMLNPCKPPGARRAVVERPLVVHGPRVLNVEWGNPSCCVTGP